MTVTDDYEDEPERPVVNAPGAIDIDHPVTAEQVDLRIDHLLSGVYPAHSRAQWQKALLAGDILVSGKQVKPSYKLRAGEQIVGRLEVVAPTVIAPAPIELDILYEDDCLVVVNKPAHLIVHPGKANYGGTLANALVHHFASLSQTGGEHRPGIVHRLDRDTTGVIVIARDNVTHEHLSAQFADRNVEKEYRAIVWGRLEFDSDLIANWVRSHSKQREKMIVCGPDPEARQAITFYNVLQRYRGFSYVQLLPKTGRTHQLRVQLSHLRHPIVADRLYGGHQQLAASELVFSKEHFLDDRVLISRQALHAYRLQFEHPRTGERMEFIAPLPDDMRNTLEALEQYNIAPE